MASSTFMLKRSNLRSGKSLPSHRSRANKEDAISFDVKGDPTQNVAHILSTICQVSGIAEGRRLNYLNAFVKVTLHIDGNFENLGFNIKDILCCLLLTLMHESTQVRSGGLRAIRHVLRNESDIICLNRLLIPHFIARSLDLMSKNDIERIEAMKLIRKVLLLSPANFDPSLGRSLVALANGGIEEKDRMLRICLATLCELGVMNTPLFIEIGGVAAVTRNLLECQTPKIAESLCGVLLLLLDKPATRNQATIDLHSVAAPYCDFHYRHGWKDKDKYVDERELRFNCSRLALLSILRSWPGIMHFCNPSNKTGLRAIVDVLYLNQLEVRKAILDLLYDLLGLPQPEWTDELSVALSAVDPCEPQSSWRLNDGFVAAEGRSILPHLAKSVPSISDMHLALLLYCFVECGLLGALSEVIATSDTFISVRATVLLGELLRLIKTLLPPECCNISPALPSLFQYATNGKPQAIKAINGLQQLHTMLSRRPASYSLHLDFILRSGSNMKFSHRSKKTKHKFKVFKMKLQQLVGKDGDDIIKETGVLLNKDAYTWNWNLIRIILKGEAIDIDMKDAPHRNFLKRIVDFYSPSRNRYSHMDLSLNKISIAYTLTGIELINCLLELDDLESTTLLRELLADILEQIVAITNGKSVHDCLFSPQHMVNTHCQSYFLFIGRLSSMETGIHLLRNVGMFKQLQHLATTTNNDCYVKLIISSMDYGTCSPSRDLLKAVLKCSNESSRLYCTQFLLVLLRAGVSSFAEWGIEVLVTQLHDSSRSVYLTALAVLHEACEMDECLEALVKINPDMKHLGEKGLLLGTRLMSSPKGFLLNPTDYVIDQIKYWDSIFNYRYVKIVEGETSDVLTLHQRDEYGKYDKRMTSVKPNNRKDFFLPPHLYGQLGQHKDGLTLLVQYGSLLTMFQRIEAALCDTDKDIFHLKASLWAIGHFGSNTEGLIYLMLHNVLVPIILLTETCTVYSIRASAFYVLGLIASTRQGADELFKLGWYCIRHNRHVSWPIHEEELTHDQDDSYNVSVDIPSDFPHLYHLDSGLRDCEDSIDEDMSESSIVSPEGSLQKQQKSSTLPPNQSLPSACHKRSLSESKTFEIIRNYDNKSRTKANFKGPDRIRYNSTTESTTSGVSSSDSVCGSKYNTNERQQILSPIPSSCSLSTLKHQGQPSRRYSESSRRNTGQSCSSSERSSYSLSGSVKSKLSHQDLVGYSTLRSIRRPLYYVEEIQSSDELPIQLAWDDASVDTSVKDNCRLTWLTKRFSVQEDNKIPDEQCYMGISLPKELHVLFSDTGPTDSDVMSIGKSTTIDDENLSDVQDLAKSVEEMFFKHDPVLCFSCCQKAEKCEELFYESCDYLTNDAFLPFDVNYSENTIKWEILRLVKRFSNPVWNRQVKQHLLQWKQQSPQVFRDICLYSEVCRMLSERMYRLMPRRMVQELFLDIRYIELYNETADVLQNTLASLSGGGIVISQNFPVSKSPELVPNTIDNESGQSSTSRNSGEAGDSHENRTVLASNIKRLDSLKLAYKENKFPIKNRNLPKMI